MMDKDIVRRRDARVRGGMLTRGGIARAITGR